MIDTIDKKGLLTMGIDPGKAGGISFIDETGKLVSYYKMMPVFEIAELSELSLVHRCFIEKSQAMSKNGAKQGVTAMFNYGQGFGELLGLLAAYKIPHVLVNPRKWQAKMLGKFPTGTSKHAAYLKAKQLWPHHTFIIGKLGKVPHNGAIDASVIAEYGRLHG